MKFAHAIAFAAAMTLKTKQTTAGSGTCLYTAANNQHGTYDYCTSQTTETRCLSNAYGGVDYGCSWNNGTADATMTANTTAYASMNMSNSTNGTYECLYTAANNRYSTLDYCTRQTTETRCLSNTYGGVDYGCSWNMTMPATPAVNTSNSTNSSSNATGACIYTAANNTHSYKHDYCTSQDNSAHCLNDMYGGVSWGCSW